MKKKKAFYVKTCVCVCVDAPLCRPGQVSVYGVSKLEDAHVTCQVDAVPQVRDYICPSVNAVMLICY